MVLSSGDYANIAQVMDVDQYDPDSTPGNSVPGEDDQDSESVAPRPVPDISLSKTPNPTSVPETGGEVTYTFVVTNNGAGSVDFDSLVDDHVR